MNGFTKLAFYPITAETNDALPTYGEPIKLYSGDLTNNVSVELTPNYVTATRKADDVVEELEKMQNYNGVLTVYGFDEDGMEKILNYSKDANGNFIIEPNKTVKGYGIFFETKEANTGKRVQAYYYKTTISPVLMGGATDEKGDQPTIQFNLKGTLVKVDGVDTAGALVVEGSMGFVANGLPSTVYVKSNTPSYSTLTFAPKDSVTEDPITEATIVVKKGTTVITAEVDGTYELTTGTYTYDISKTGYVSQTAVSFVISAADVTTGSKTIEPELVSDGE
jgi:hypothetical protein